ncbi:ATP-binding protein [uncultured Fluviicola sp.]|uniref:ATP-binding protein n=1 Tax=uncultured Fluviicola sp. TaxID=463303 RepID=UPI0025FFDCBB|nr:ATP-binding protein [uncultured Fluviicola sp.]
MKTPILSNRPIDFTQINPGEFEEIVYHYFNEQIKNNLFNGIYDKVHLSVGVGERGADLMLYNNDKVVGCVQCKKYNGNVSETVIFDDLVKFLLNHISECRETGQPFSTLIHSIHSFTYYFVAAKDITQDAKILIGDFSQNRKKLNLQKTVESTTAKYNKLKHLDYLDVVSELEELLDSIRILQINSTDIDTVIRSNINIFQKYFAVEKVIDEQTVQELKNHLGIDYSKEKILELAKNASSSITGLKTHFGNNSSSTILRSEVKDILYWLQNPLKENQDNIAVVSGNAGLGKSVVMLQLYDQLKQESIPTICLKADRLAFDTVEELGRESGLGTDFFTFMDQFISYEPQVVLIIDQIDALSQTLSSNMRPLGMYDRVIKRYANQSKVRIVVSCRTYDLNYDPIINTYSNKINFAIKPLDIDELKQILSINKINPGKLNRELIELLKTPLHLDVFLKVYSDDLEISTIKSIQDLYRELWNLRITSNRSEKSKNIDFAQVVKLVFSIALKMYEDQSINIPDDSFTDLFPKELEYLSTEGVVFRRENHLEFFHQTFFDYCVARNSVTSKEDLLTTIKNRHQGLFLRSKIQQILNYKRGVDVQRYIKDLQAILADSQIRFHIKLLVLRHVALQDTPLVQEQQFIEKIFKDDKKSKDIFISLYHGDGWLDIFIDKKWIQQEVNSNDLESLDLIRSFLRRFTHRKSEQLINFIIETKSSISIDPIIQDLLWGVREYNDSRYMDLVEYILDKIGEPTLGYALFHFLEHGIKNYPERVCDILLRLVSIGPDSKDQYGQDDYFPGQNHSEIYKELWENHPDITYLLVKRIINEIIDKRGYSSSNKKRGAIKVDRTFLLYTKKEEQLYFHSEQLSMLQDYLIEKANTDHDFVRREVLEYLKSESITHLIIAFSVVEKHPLIFLQESFQFFSTDVEIKKIIGLSLYMNYLLQASLGNAYPHYSPEQQKIVNSMLVKLYPDSELMVIDFGDGKKIRKSYGNTQYDFIRAIPNSERNRYPELKRSFQELKRKFGDRGNLEEPKGISLHSGEKMLPQDAFDKMTFEDWKRTFREYNIDNPNYDSWNDPGELSHSREFENRVSQRIEYFLPLIDDILIDSTIPQSYKVKGLEGLKNGGLPPDHLLIRFKTAIQHTEFNNEYSRYLLWITNYFTEAGINDKEVFEFIKNISINGSERDAFTNDVLNMGINSTRGAAVSSLMDYHFSDKSREEVFGVLRTIANNSSPSTRACALYKLANYLKYNTEEVLEIFLLLLHDYDPGLVKLSVHVLTYLINTHFKELIPFLKRSIYVKDSSKTVGHLLTKAYCFDYSGSEELLEEFWSQGNDQKEASIAIAWEFIKVNERVNRALKIVSKFLDSDDDKIAKAYIFPFFNLQNELFDQLYEFLSLYVESNVGKYREDSFYRYLLKCVNDKPEKCIQLAAHFVNHIDKMKNHQMHRNEPLQVIIQAYNCLREYNKDDKATEDAMDAFDLILQNLDLRAGAFEVLAKVDLY